MTKAYKYRRSAFKAASKLKQHTAERGADGLYRIRPMTIEEKYRTSIQDTVDRVLQPAIVEQFNRISEIHRRFARSA